MKQFIENLTKRLSAALGYSIMYDEANVDMKEYIRKDIEHRMLPYVPVRLRETVGEVLETINANQSYESVITELWKIRDVLCGIPVNDKQYGIVSYIAENSQLENAKDELLLVVSKLANDPEETIAPTRSVQYDPYNDVYLITITIEAYSEIVTVVMCWKDGVLVVYDKDSYSTYY